MADPNSVAESPVAGALSDRERRALNWHLAAVELEGGVDDAAAGVEGAYRAWATALVAVRDAYDEYDKRWAVYTTAAARLDTARRVHGDANVDDLGEAALRAYADTVSAEDAALAAGNAADAAGAVWAERAMRALDIEAWQDATVEAVHADYFDPRDIADREYEIYEITSWEDASAFQIGEEFPTVTVRYGGAGFDIADSRLRRFVPQKDWRMVDDPARNLIEPVE